MQRAFQETKWKILYIVEKHFDTMNFQVRLKYYERNQNLGSKHACNIPKYWLWLYLDYEKPSEIIGKIYVFHKNYYE